MSPPTEPPYGIELDPYYCDVILRRMAAIAKLDAVLVATGQSFAAVATKHGDAEEVDHSEAKNAQATAAEAAE
ncbi:MAG: hypothetical protein ACT4OU_11995 [Hyphomicrobium sp.]